MIAPRLHTVTRLSRGAAFRCFREACQGGGDPPQWTLYGDDPAAWRAPDDAAGGLVLWDQSGTLLRMEPAGAPDLADQALWDLRCAGGAWGIVRATYASSGGRMVALCEGEGWTITVCRMEATPRAGATERNILAADPAAEVYVLRSLSR